MLPDLGGGGAEKVFSVLLRHFDRARVEPSLCLLNAGGRVTRFSDDIPADVPVDDLKAPRARYAYPGLLAWIRRFRHDAVLSSLGHVNLLLLATRPFLPRDTRLVVREANEPSLSLRHAAHPVMTPFLYRLLYPRADAVICQSSGIAEELRKIVGTARVRRVAVLPNPVDVAEIRKTLGPAPGRSAAGPLRIVAAGRLVKQKGFDRLLEAFRFVLRESPGASLLILGEGAELESLRALAVDLGVAESVTFGGFRLSPFADFAAADVFALPSRWEGLPNAALEALACGTPVAAFSGVGAVAEAVLEGVNGAFAGDPGAEAFARALFAAAGIKRGKSGESLLDPRFDAPAATRAYEDVMLNG